MTGQRTTSLHPTESSMKNATKYYGNFVILLSSSTDQQDQPVIKSLVYVILFICLLGLVGNGLVLWFLGFHIKRNAFTVYVLNLAAADFGFLLCLALSCTVFDFNLLYLSMSLDLLMVFTYSTRLSFLTAISVERCASVLCSIWYRSYCPKHLSAILCALLWALSCLLTGLKAYVCFSDSCSEHRQEILLQLTRMNFQIFTPIIVLTSLILIIKVQRSSLRHQPRKLYIVISLNVLFFLLLIVSFSIVTFFQKAINYDYFINSSLMLAPINSSINPVIYFLIGSYRNQQFGGSVKKALRSMFEEEADIREERVSAT
ncbi:proto-oncogene Mas-like [Pelodiscus sinensis]|uniref:proto-oncogene Mas-like n=1 Tax=Pelodiscus sinensis TaxID=13735 RepID=UPI0003C46B85|nr:proto-oncogene Mas-like [Pelodiscus sinensis]|eukprot:XP_006136446.1 proto-oncogene Mas-like [Pelodiscus sinensis]